MVIAMMVAFFPAMGFAENNNNNGCDDCEPFMEVDLIAGQNQKVGTVTVTNDNDQLCVTYALDDEALEKGWLIYETHLYIGDGEFEGVLTRPNVRAGGPYMANPIPGQFPYGDTFDEGREEWSFCIDFDDLGFGICEEVYIAAHAVIERSECEVIEEAPYGGSRVVDSYQAFRIDHTPENPQDVKLERSNAENVLEIGIPGQETFFSLGYGGKLDEGRNAVGEFFGEYFENRRTPESIKEMEAWVDEDLAGKLSDTRNNAGWIIIEFDPAVLNVEDDYDLQVIEDTWGLPYPLELAAVFGREDENDDWTFLFLAHNQQPVGSPTYHTYTNGKLGDLNKAVQILVQDVSDPKWFIPYPHSVATLDGFDLNAVVALNNYVECMEYDETAWGDGSRFNERGNWGMWFMYKICPPEVCEPASVVYGVTGNGSNGGLYQIEIADGVIEETLLKSIENVNGATNFYPNGLAYDYVKNRLYFAIRKSGSTTANLYFWDFDPESEIVLAATGLPAEVYGATWGAGKYWFIPNGSNDMYTVNFDDDGKNGTSEVFEANFANGKSFNFGDIALDADESVIYVSTSFSGTNREFFKYDLKKDSGERYETIVDSNFMGKAVGLQLGFAEDENLYGHDTFGSSQTGASAKEWFSINKLDGSRVSLGIGVNAYNDLASGPSFCD